MQQKKLENYQFKWGEIDIDLSKRFERKTFYGLLNEATGSDISLLDDNELFDVCKNQNLELDKKCKYWANVG